MSYDLMVFAREAAPEGREAFMGWFHKITKWGEEHDYDDPAYTSPKLRDWYRDMVSVFPAMNGPDGVADDHPAHHSGHVTDYTCARDAIYVGFSWNLAEEAYHHTLTYAAIHKVGFFDVSTPDGAVWLPSASGYRVVHGGTSADRDRERTLANLSDDMTNVLSDVHKIAHKTALDWIYRRDARELPTRMLEAIQKMRAALAPADERDLMLQPILYVFALQSTNLLTATIDRAGSRLPINART